MTNQQRAFVKAYAIRTYGLHAAKWNGSELVGKKKGDKQWKVIYRSDEAEGMIDKVRREATATS